MNTPSRPERLAAFYTILNLPIDLGWAESLQDDRNNWFYYLHSLLLLGRSELDAIYQRRARVEPNRGIDTLLKNIDCIFLERTRARTVADIGAGWGMITLWLLLSGVEKVYAIGDPKRTAWIGRVATEARNRGLLSQGRLVLVPRFVGPGDSVLLPETAAASVDLCLLHDTLEHISPRVLPALFRSCFQQLRPGGVLISRSHDSDCPRVAAALKELWRRTDREVYRAQRISFIRAHTSELDEAAIERLADVTRGLDREQLTQATDTGTWAESARELPPIDIEANVVEEGFTGRAYIEPMLASAGFEVRAFPFLGSSRRSAWLQGVAERFPQLFWRGHFLDDQIVYIARRPF